jgi:type II secretory pathway pseudopilin PulG
MYKVILPDQKEYGPVTADQLRQWIAEGRVNAQASVMAEGATEWKPLSAFPEFAGALPSVAAATGAPRAVPPGAPRPIPKTSGMAIASLVLGILGGCGITALVGLILGIISMNKIRQSKGALTGNGIALAGTIVSGIFLLMIPLLAAMLLPAFAKAKERAQTIQCVNNMKQLSLAVRLYSNDNNDRFPPAATWCDAILADTGGSTKIFQCPAGDGSKRCDYAFNAKLGGANANKANPMTVLLFEAGGGWNASGGPELMLKQPRHGRIFVVAFADGSVQQFHESDVAALRWNP